MKRIIFATHNAGKAQELSCLMGEYGYEVLTLKDLGYEIDIKETGGTFEENALIKARLIADEFKLAVAADDSGLEVDALNGAPGIYSARYAGEDKCDSENIKKLLLDLSDIPKNERSARFVCVLALFIPGGDEIVVRATCEGEISFAPAGAGGFGYDSVFYLPSLDKTMAQLTSEEKNLISHRAKAMKKLEERIGDKL